MSSVPPPVTLDDCANEPIHVPGSIQPHGVLFSTEGDAFLVRQVSDNSAEHTSFSPDDLLGKSLFSLFDDDSAASLARAKNTDAPRSTNVLRVVDRRGKVFDAVVHRAPAPSDRSEPERERTIVELEPSFVSVDEAYRPVTFDARLRHSVVRMQGARSLDELYQVTAEEVRAITGFDRVMVYRFDREWNGCVTAESKREDLEPFLGQHYPASDIPAQARRLYTLNWLRLIGDVAYVPRRLVPARDVSLGRPLDMSFAVLRSVSPIHIQYLENMGVRASMSVSLVDSGKLVGLVACHHYAGPKLLPVALRETAEYLGRTLSWHVRALERADEAERARVVQVHEAELVRRMVIEADLLDSLDSPALVALTEADGAAVVLQEGTKLLGKHPPESTVRDLVRWLSSRTSDVYETDALSAEWRREIETPGLVAVALSRQMGEWLLWFREPTEKVIDWGGDPRKAYVPVEGEKHPRLSPRGSFALWREVVKGRSIPWEPWQVEAASSLRRLLVGGLRQRAAKLREMNERLVATDRARDEFIATVSHELRNPLNAISGWTRLLQEGTLPADRRTHALEVIARNVAEQTQLVEDLLDVSRMASGKLSLEVETVDMVALVESTLESVRLAVEAKEIRLRRILDSHATPVMGDSLRLRQVLTNLLNNAVKFTPKGGSITVVLARVSSDMELCVIDSGRGISAEFLPQVFELFRQQDSGMNRRSQGLGLGLTLVKRVVELHGGSVLAESEGEGKGSTFRVRLPMSAVRSSGSSQKLPPSSGGGDSPASLAPSTPKRAGVDLVGLRVLVVEDEEDSRELLRVVLEAAGARVVAAECATTALTLLSSDCFDAIISDIGMPEVDGFQFLRELRTRPASLGGKVPAVALTAYTRAVDRTTALRAGFQAHVPKPVDVSELVAVVASVATRL